jgi:hypothetical protein
MDKLCIFPHISCRYLFPVIFAIIANYCHQLIGLCGGECGLFEVGTEFLGAFAKLKKSDY